jgi:hypothetical protein
MTKFIERTSVLLVLSVFFLGLLVSCNKDDDDNPESGTANFNISLENSAAKSSAAYESVNIDIQQVSIHSSSDTASDSGWHNLETQAGVYDLLDYAAGNDTLIAFDSVLTTQKVSQIRLLLGGNNTVVEDGTSHELKTPSGQTSGLKILVNADLVAGKSYKIVLDFDSDKSVNKTGNNNYQLKPVIKATVIEQ